MMEQSAETSRMHSRAIRPHSPIRIDWASLQSSSRGSSGESKTAEGDVFQTPPPKPVALSTAFPDNTQSAALQSQADLNRRVYDIPALMQLRGSFAGIGVFAKIKPEALTGMYIFGTHPNAR